MDYLDLLKLLRTKTLLLIFISHTGLASDKTVNSTLDLVKSLIPALNKQGVLKTDGCAFNKKAWSESVLTQKSFQEKITYNKTCDLKGSYQVAPHKFFPLHYDIRNHPSFNRFESTFKYGVVFEEKPVLIIEMKKAKLKGKSNVDFKFTYGIYVNPLEKNPLASHKGGKLTLLRVDGQEMNKTIPIKLQ